MDFSSRLLAWYDKNKRTLPWRGSRDPYVIWISEIIFQQTRIEQGTSYFLRFIERFPTVHALADADEEEVLKMWQGLGYYSRARNLHMTAGIIRDRFNGGFPAEFKELLGLRGVGDYTASCIASICYGQPHAAVDGNVFRVLSRHYSDRTPINSGIGKRRFKEMAQRLIDTKRPGDFNEAMMDLGATVCLPRSPICGKCPVAEDCTGKLSGNPTDFPVVLRDKPRRTRHFNYLVLKDDNHIILHKRTGRDIWTGMYELPLVEGEMSPFALVAEFNDTYGIRVSDIQEISRIKHPLSHQDLEIRFFAPTGPAAVASDTNDLVRPGFNELKKLPFPRPIAQFLENGLTDE